MAVVISGTNNSDKITATDGLIDLLSSVNFASEVTVPSFKVGSDIQFGNAGIITATTLVGNVQGNINHTSNLLLQISGSEKFRVGTSGQLGIGGANYGTSGQVLTSGGSGSAASWTTITGTTINSNADNRIITGSGSANTLNGESNLTFDGTNLSVVSPDISVGSGATISSLGNVTAGIATFAGGVTFKGSNGTLHWRMKPSGSFEPQFNNFFNIGDTYYACSNIFTNNLTVNESIIHNLDTNTKISFPAADTISFSTAGSDRIRIDSSGRVGINRTPALASSKLEVGGADNYPLINVEASGATGGMGIGGAALKFFYGTSEKLLIHSDGQIQAGTSAPTYLKYTGSAVATNNNNGTLLGSNNIGLIGQYSSLNMPFDHSTANVSGAWWMLGRCAGTTNEWGLYTRSGGQSNLLSVWKVIGNSNGTTDYQTFSTGSNSERLRITSSGHVLPGADNSQDLGSSSLRWKDLYIGDAHFSNRDSKNEVDGTWGDWTLQEGESKIFMINNRTGKKYSLVMEEE